MKAMILQALQNTFVGDTAKLAETHSILSQFAKNKEYCWTLMEIVADENFNVPIKQAALIQLKNNIRLKWKNRNLQLTIPKDEKDRIRNTLVYAMIRCGKNYQLIKLYREVITIIVTFDYEEWIPLKEIQQCFSKNENVEPALQCLIAIATTFEFAVKKEEKKIYDEFLKILFPQIIGLVQNNMNNWQIIYLSIKFFWKSVHSQISQEVKVISLGWMELFHNILTYQNEENQKKVHQFYQKRTPEFYYFHCKKWTTRIILRYLQKHAKEKLFVQEIENKEFSELWHSKYGHVFLKTVIQQVTVPTIKKVRFFQFKCLQNWITQKPLLIQEYGPGFQYKILPQYIKLKPQDETLANNDPIEYITNEEEPGMNFTNLKKAATELWVTFTQLGSRTDHQNNAFTTGPFFSDNFNYILNNLASANLLDKEFAMFLFCEIRYTIIRVPEAKNMLLDIFKNYIVNELQSSAMLMRMRANDVFNRYGKQEQLMDMNLITKTAEGIYLCLSADPSPLVRIKAASAFHNLLKNPNAKQLVKPKLKQILQIYLKLIELYDLEQLVYGLERIVENFASQIGPFAIEMFKILAKLFIKLFNKDIEQNANNSQYEGQTEIAAAGILKTMSQIIESPLQQKIRSQIQADVLEIVYFVLSGESVEYSEQIFDLLNTHIYKINILSPGLWLFYQTIIYFLVGIPEQYWKQIQKTNMPQKLKSLLLNLKDSENIEYFEHAFLVLRNFMSKGADMICSQNALFKQNFVHVLFYLINTIYKNHSKGLSEGENDLDCCTILTIYFIETFPLDMINSVLTVIWSYCKFNCHKAKSTYLKSLTTQLIGTMIWKYKEQFIKLVITDNSLPLALNTLNKYPRLLEEKHQRKRVIMGFITLLLLPQKPQSLLDSMGLIFKNLIKLIKKNTRSRIILYKYENRNSPSLILDDPKFKDESSDFDEDCIEEDEDEQFWDEQFTNNYSSPLRHYDEIDMFKESMRQIQNNDNTFYTALIQSLAPEKLAKLQYYFEKLSIILQNPNPNPV